MHTMPIQFRCQYCRQLLGISQSRAGSVVDCPACGRSLSVPSGKGSPKQKDTGENYAADQALQNALEELSSLRNSTAASRHANAKVTEAAPKPVDSGGRNDRDSLRIVPLASSGTDAPRHHAESEQHSEPAGSDDSTIPSAPAAREFAEAENAVVSIEAALEPGSEETHPQQTFDGLSGDCSQALSELSGIAASDRQPALRAMNFASHTVSPVLAAAMVMVMVMIAFAAGYFMGNRQEPSGPVAIDPAAGSGNDKGAAAAAAFEQKAAIPPGSALSIKVTFADIDGRSRPDKDTLLLLLPVANFSGLRLDARPLRELATSLGKTAVESALRELLVSVGRAGDDGTVVLERHFDGPGRLIAISRHTSRESGEEIAPSITAALSDWFDAPAYLTGRLAVHEAQLPANEEHQPPTNPIEIHFTTTR